MPRKEGQKLKLLTLLEIFVRETDEKHPISVPRMVELLKERGIVAERKSVYDDIQTLNEMPNTPFEIVQQRGRGGGYYMVDTPFELAELKLLVDAVYASKFITARKSKVLIEKLGQFTSRYRQEELDRRKRSSTAWIPCTAPSRLATRCGSNTVTGTWKSRWCPAMTASCTPSAPG